MSSAKLILFLLTVIHFSFLPFLLQPDLNYLNYLLFFLLLLSSVTFVKFIFRNPRSEVDFVIDKTDFAVIVSILVLATALSLIHIHEVSIWMDESEEGRNVLSFPDILVRSSFFQQPPLAMNLIVFRHLKAGAVHAHVLHKAPTL